MEYKTGIKMLLDHSKNIDFTTLISSIILLYGVDSSIEESVLKKILVKILSEDGYNMACFICNNPEASEVFNWHYDISEGEGYITIK